MHTPKLSFIRYAFQSFAYHNRLNTYGAEQNELTFLAHLSVLTGSLV